MKQDDNANALRGKVAVVTGASRGLGKATAIELGRLGATVYLTSRGGHTGSEYLGTVEAAAEEVTRAGGHGIAVHCDQASDEQLAALMQRVEREQGRLDVLVNCAFPAPQIEPLLAKGERFWEAPLDLWRLVVDIGCRSHYVASVYAMPMLLKTHGLVVNISSAGGQIYYHSVAYGIGKAGMDRLARDMAVELKGTGVTTVSIWPGVVRTELMSGSMDTRPEVLPALLGMATAHFDEDPWADPDTPKGLDATETPHFTGRAIAALAADPSVNAKAGRVLATVLLADEYGFTDLNGKRPDGFHFRKLKYWPSLTH